MSDALTAVGIFHDEIISLCKNLKDEFKHYIEIGIVDYLDRMANKFLKTKTFLFRSETVNFYDIYFPITLHKNIVKKEKLIIIDDLVDLFRDNNCLSITGGAGSGKSMLIKHIFLLSIKQGFRIPIIIELRNLNTQKISLFEYIKEQILINDIAPNRNILKRMFKNGDFLFLFDGYDEILNKRREKLTIEINNFTELYCNNRYLLTSRPGVDVEALPYFNNYYVTNLNKSQIKEFIKLQVNTCDDAKLGENIIQAIFKKENFDYIVYLSSPMLLSMFILTFRAYPELPRSKCKFYWNVFDTLCTKHDTFTKSGGYQHERVSGLQTEDFEKILQWFSFASLFKGVFNFDERYLKDELSKIKNKLDLSYNIDLVIKDLTVAISIIMIDGLEMKFPHRSMQEYFAALLISSLPNEKKELVYKNKMSNMENDIFRNGETFWNLLNELDEKYFNELFIIYNIEEFLKIIKKRDKEQTLSEIMVKKYKISNTFIFNDEIIKQTSLHASFCNMDSVLEYVGIGDIVGIFLFMDEDKLKANIDQIIKIKKLKVGKSHNENKHVKIVYAEIWDKDIERMFINLDIEEKLSNVLKKSEVTLQELKNYINKKNDSLDDLLEI